MLLFREGSIETERFTVYRGRFVGTGIFEVDRISFVKPSIDGFGFNSSGLGGLGKGDRCDKEEERKNFFHYNNIL